MDYEILSIAGNRSSGNVQRHNMAIALLYFCCLGFIGCIFAIGCFILFLSGLILDLLAFLGLLVVALGSLVWGRLKRVEGPSIVRRITGYFRNPVWK